MGDVGDGMRALRAASRERRRLSRLAAPSALWQAGIAFTEHNHGAHLIVADEWDFWPGTGKWCHRGPPQADGRGVFNLIQVIKESPT